MERNPRHFAGRKVFGKELKTLKTPRKSGGTDERLDSQLWRATDLGRLLRVMQNSVTEESVSYEDEWMAAV